MCDGRWRIAPLISSSVVAAAEDPEKPLLLLLLLMGRTQQAHGPVERSPRSRAHQPLALASGDIGKVARDDDDDHSSAKIIVREQEQGPEQIEGTDWDQDKLDEKIDCYLQQLNRGLPGSDDDDFWVHCHDRQRREMNERLALCRIRAHEVSVIVTNSDVVARIIRISLSLDLSLKRPLWLVSA